jgi:hypothetical protein
LIVELALQLGKQRQLSEILDSGKFKNHDAGLCVIKLLIV